MTKQIKTINSELIVMRELGKIDYEKVREEYETLLDTLAIAGLPDYKSDIRKVINKTMYFDYKYEFMYIIAYNDVLLKYTSLDTTKITDERYNEHLLNYIRNHVVYKIVYNILFKEIGK